MPASADGMRARNGSRAGDARTLGRAWLADRTRVAVLFAITLLTWPIAAQETPEDGDTPPPAPSGEATPPSAPDGAASADPPPSDRGDVYEWLGPQLFPLYEHYYRTADETTVRNILYLYRTTSRPDGSYSRLLAPFFYRSENVDPKSSTFHLFPLLYFSGDSEDESYRLSLPLYYDFQSAQGGFRALVPFWAHTASDGHQLSTHHVLFPLFRHRTDQRNPQETVVRTRLGLPYILELAESRITDLRTDRTALNLFNWWDETEGGLPLYKSSWVRAGDRDHGSTYLFPFYWRGRDVDGGHLAVVPFFLVGDRGPNRYQWVFPFYGYTSDGAGVDVYVGPILSRFGGGPGTSRRIDAPFPFFHYARSDDAFSIAFRPFYHYWRNDNEIGWGSLLGLFRRRHTIETGKTSTSFLFPLFYHDVEPDGSRGNRWFFPYYDTFNEQRRWRFVIPLGIEHQRLAGGEMDRFFRYGVPTYFAWGEPNDSFGFGFPLWWESGSANRSWHLFIPLYFDRRTRTSTEVYALPFVLHRSFPSRHQLHVLWPAYSQTRFFDTEGESRGFGLGLAWPIFRAESRDDGYHYRLLPLGWVSREGETSDFLVSLFYYQQDGPAGTHRHFIPFYGRYDSERVSRDYYAAGTVIRTKERNDSGDVVRRRLDLLWSLASFEREFDRDASHSHVLPPLYWKTRTPPVDRTIVAPFYYSHRIADSAVREEYHLSLTLGNLFLAKDVYSTLPSDGSIGGRDGPGWTPEGRALVAEAAKAEALEGGARESSDESSEPTPPAVDAPSEDSAVPPGGVDRDADPSAPDLFPLAEAESPPSAESGSHLNPLGAGEGEAPTRELLSSERGVLWPLSRWYRRANGERGAWVLPFYYSAHDDHADTLALFPFYFGQNQTRAYSPSFLRYFYLFDRETWKGGHRWTFGQLLADWKVDEPSQSKRLRLLYPLFNYERSPESYVLEFTPALHFEAREARGERSTNYRFFPVYWQGKRERQIVGNEWELDREHLFLFPLFGYHSRSTRSDYYALFPLFHLQDARDSLSFELWPSLFYRNEASLHAVRVWPLHADETGESAGDFWVSRFLFLSKRFSTASETVYRFDPWLFWIRSGADGHGWGSLFHLFAYDRRGDDWSFHAIPFALGAKKGDASFWGVFPFYYSEDFGDAPIRYTRPWRFLFPVNRLEGEGGERYLSILWALYDRSSNPQRPDYFESRVLLGLYLNRQTETSRQFAIHPFYTYTRDDTTGEEELSVLFNLYGRRRAEGRTTHTIFWFVKF